MLDMIQLLRPKQWIKNSFVLVPLVFSGLFLDLSAVLDALIAVVLFSLASSSSYIINDIQDVEKDRLHPKKSKTRPLASGVVTIFQAKLMLVFLYSILMAAMFFFPKLMAVIGIYMVVNVLYSLKLKHLPVWDIFTIASGFVLRVYAGAVAIATIISPWMFVTTLCLALYLAAIKRRQELVGSGAETREVLNVYTISLVDRYAEMAATGALVFYSLFVMTVKPQMIYTIPFVLFGLFRYWWLVEHTDECESPTDALINDKTLVFTVFVWGLMCLYALWPA